MMLAAVGALAVGALAGCASDAGPAATTIAPAGGPPAVSTSPPPATATAAASTAPATNPPAATNPTAPVSNATVPAPGAGSSGICPASALSLRVADPEGAAGSTYERLVLTNTGTVTCALRGFPGVSYLDAAGAQVGAAATRTGAAATTVSLAPGGSASAVLRIVHPGIQEGCLDAGQITAVTALRVYPPGSHTALRQPLSDTSACASTSVQQLSVTALTG
ncbi:DUF4232 domain-containing protein [Frankia sp. AgPm24]|uniref:DUF4232 domain-containing protein n=1 Tax=Frankia sp. AgPm24 TaxID=631128 RepID=UPI00200EBF15|nr:DUF4232 domain-containing protein [Frankia sp. AgPm24]MCK9924816.1 DUF4232 domain-containing protein [Frankia sp. AgPm24]